ncbi:hypothetical protein [Desulfofustis limnaeus]|uniref:DUF4015 domain-containing protein n=1 Tax=Desulfofustis limnaeus TaxID=2740163 RepID=A0ABN6M1D5_9BACT|nr:hypothetical protein [Desulfofustis limnaeus]BDD86660.1 hypothetical protein DPPLL_10250 [Desulfofustis limnaeus]
MVMRGWALVLAMLIGGGLTVSAAGNAGATGVYGVTADWVEDKNRTVGRVFLPGDKELIARHRQAGREVYLTLNVFGGRQAWQLFPDSVPILADGTSLAEGANHGGVCPTHPGWRANRLAKLVVMVREFGGQEGIGGIWLDFIRYPGRWEQPDPELPDTCYCPRCLDAFQRHSNLRIPERLVSVGEQARWIKEQAAYAWVVWKKEQITSFVREARDVLQENSGVQPLQLGVFLVPWRQADFNGALSFQLAQDAQQFAPYVDQLSPMVYHRMVGRDVAWVEELGRYYDEVAPGRVWPIVQAEEVGAEEFEQVLGGVARSGADDVLVYSYRTMLDHHWRALSGFVPSANLIGDPRFTTVAQGGLSEAAAGDAAQSAEPRRWSMGGKNGVSDSRFFHVPAGDGNGPAVGIEAGRDGQGRWSIGLPRCEAGRVYRFSGDFYRGDRNDHHAYPEVEVWGQQERLNTHRMVGGFQRLQTLVTCPEQLSEAESRFSFWNRDPGATFWLKQPRLEPWVAEGEAGAGGGAAPPGATFFPIGVYGAKVENLGQIKELGLSAAVIGMTEEAIAACREQGVHCLLAVPREAERLLTLLQRIDAELDPEAFSFYVNDEPEIHSFPVGTAIDIRRLLKERYPRLATAMAVVRPQALPFYQGGADFFMLDQYPVPNMPLVWLADSLDGAAATVGVQRLQAVIQAFGGEKHAFSGWPRRPSFAEMNCLAFLAVIHGSRGLYFYSFPEITGTTDGREEFGRVIRRLNSLRSWLALENEAVGPEVTVTSRYGLDPAGRPAVHCAVKRQQNTRLLICANTIATSVNADIAPGGSKAALWQDYFQAGTQPLLDGRLRHRFDPYEVVVWMEQ